jgi:hypothetical protein
LPASRRVFLPAAIGGGQYRSGIFNKIGSNFVVKIRNDKTFFFFPDEIVGGALRRPRKSRENSRKSDYCAADGI